MWDGGFDRFEDALLQFSFFMCNSMCHEGNGSMIK